MGSIQILILVCILLVHVVYTNSAVTRDGYTYKDLHLKKIEFKISLLLGTLKKCPSYTKDMRFGPDIGRRDAVSEIDFDTQIGMHVISNLKMKMLQLCRKHLSVKYNGTDDLYTLELRTDYVQQAIVQCSGSEDKEPIPKVEIKKSANLDLELWLANETFYMFRKFYSKMLCQKTTGVQITQLTSMTSQPSTTIPTTPPTTTIQSTTLSYCQDNATFTTLGATGRLGPKTLGSHYVNQSQDGMVRLDKGIQMFTVPCTGKYRISVAGAASAYSKSSPIEFRGRGAWLSGVFHLTKGSILKILVGQVGGYNKRLSTGGGGGTFITDINNKPIIIAGGGGGTQSSNSRHWQCDGTTNTTGNPNYGGTLYQGGKDGQGTTDGPSGIASTWTGGGGGGLLSDGKDGSVIGSYTRPSGGKAFVHGGEGGIGSKYNLRATGGFGGGGGAGGAGGGGGGGGGYSGGAKGDNAYPSCAGGGGSYNTGSHQQGKSGDNDGEGYALITWIE